jgi:hypothetical protein
MRWFACPHRLRLVFIAFLLCALAPFPLHAQARNIGVGARLAFPPDSTGTSQQGGTSNRFVGGLLRVRMSPRTAVELSVDYQSRTNDTLTERVRNIPVQGSLLLYPVRAAISTYVLGGIGRYSERVETLSNNSVVSSTTTSRIGYHGGLGGELQLGRRAALHLDYRYTLIHFGSHEGVTTSPGALPIPGLIGLQDKLQLSHEGSMWTTGLTVYF